MAIILLEDLVFNVLLIPSMTLILEFVDQFVVLMKSLALHWENVYVFQDIISLEIHANIVLVTQYMKKD